MVYPLSERAPSASNLTAKNRVWGFFENSNRTRPANRRKPSELRRKIRLTPTKTASGIPYWPSRDPIGESFETGEINLYSFVGSDGLNYVDVAGLKKYSTGNQKVQDIQKQRKEKIKKDHEGMLDKNNERADKVEKIMDGIDEILDAVEDPVGSLGEAVARKTSKKECDKLFKESGFKAGCACCVFSLKNFTILTGGAGAAQQWMPWGASIKNQNCNAYLDDIAKAIREAKEYRAKHKLPDPPVLDYKPQDNEATAKIVTEYIDY